VKQQKQPAAGGRTSSLRNFGMEVFLTSEVLIMEHETGSVVQQIDLISVIGSSCKVKDSRTGPRESSQ
jgi:hypothetical protein